MEKRVVLYDHGNLHVDAVERSDGTIVIEGQDLSGDGEYEYFLTVFGDQIPSLVVALGGKPGQDVLALLEQHGERIVRHGERRWLVEHHVMADLWTWGSPPL
ncbi:hypothetical protein Q6346_00190 [Isoptericola sp. b490]|uniref:hypothetical protein n=1 Tax=Actinotalea lenta TaxID=3064654 RepID=UPI002713F8C4|nr:hypothetical protein [Isoptericola sp. b490]MDO8119726.1 hypothetical protein [Isoptericola sp. b490]